MSIWRPIETAPKDGTQLLLWWDSKPVISYYAERTGFKGWQPPSMMPIKVTDRSTWNPTHWTPLPSAPSDPAQEPEAVALKPCPFCGGEAGYEESFGSPTIRCIADHCYVRPIFRCFASKDEVIQQWNTRPVSLEREVLPDELSYILEGIILRRLREDKIAGYVFETAKEQTDAILALIGGRA